jgi:nucleolar protein 56
MGIMKIILLPSVYGFLAVADSKVVESLYIDKSPRILAETYIQFQKGTAPVEMRQFLQSLKTKGYSSFEVEDPAYLDPINGIIKGSAELISDPSTCKALRSNFNSLLTQIQIATDAPTIASRTKTLAEFMDKLQVAEISTQHDLHIKQAVDTLNDVNKITNILATRLREWYGLHYPELTDKLVDDHVKFTQFVAKIGTRDKFNAELLQKEMELTPTLAELISDKAARSMGGLLDPFDIQTLQTLANRILDLYQLRQQLDDYISKTLDQVAPNLKAVIGSNVASLLIGIAGSLERLAQFPSSTIQVLGAEKALFKALKFGAKTPKHGIIFQWHKIRSQKSYLRGKISRMVAGKISILAKVDYYKGAFIGDKIGKEIDDKIENIKKMFPNPPKVKRAIKVQPIGQPTHGGGRSDFSRRNKQFGKTNEKAHFKSKHRGKRNFK